MAPRNINTLCVPNDKFQYLRDHASKFEKKTHIAYLS